MYGKIKLLEDTFVIKNKWDKSKYMSKLCYLNKFSLGTKINGPMDYLPDNSTFENIDEGIKNFAVISIKINLIDWLNLSHKEHQR